MPSMLKQLEYDALEKEFISCAYCDSEDYLVATQHDRYNFGIQTVVCKNCGLIFTNPRPPEDWFDTFYNEYYRYFYKSMEEPTEKHISSPWITGRHKRNIDFLSPHLLGKGKLLDIGASDGTFMYLFQKAFHDWTLKGIDPSQSFVNYAHRTYGVDIVVDSFTALESWDCEQYNLISANHVLEHLLFPNKFFEYVRCLLQKDGLLFLDVPDADARLRGAEGLHIAHVYHFNERTLTLMLKKFGFEVKNVARYPHKKPWTLQIIARKTVHNSTHKIQPHSMNATKIAREFAKNNSETMSYKLFKTYYAIYKYLRVKARKILKTL